MYVYACSPIVLHCGDRSPQLTCQLARIYLIAPRKWLFLSLRENESVFSIESTEEENFCVAGNTRKNLFRLLPLQFQHCLRMEGDTLRSQWCR